MLSSARPGFDRSSSRLRIEKATYCLYLSFSTAPLFCLRATGDIRASIVVIKKDEIAMLILFFFGSCAHLDAADFNHGRGCVFHRLHRSTLRLAPLSGARLSDRPSSCAAGKNPPAAPSRQCSAPAPQSSDCGSWTPVPWPDFFFFSGLDFQKRGSTFSFGFAEAKTTLTATFKSYFLNIFQK